ncbi:hypothetical protein RJZ56_004386 [Blastomyces dermatitidis]|uniref:Mold-specific protein n=2 Tax=Blastomyces TaxID=229219 RepID=A0A179UY13_BLAGS|nr:mold-specific protein [Blastomyces gilchristii SLH14081]EGE81974.1 hypothetical protein BDDG_04917 [Blastomyces dermatitidis ATCC 18188]EQL35810.1 hypothetical protein BDFG_02432 [Blastomyces dermatitidis ATCC 26199]OAT12730.1 mold-specific protein [Blastomyces gilchristii SLH14081]
MKSLLAVCGLVLAVTVSCQDFSPVFNLPECPRSCILETSGRANEFGCSPGDVACLCKNEEYQRALMDCAKKCKPEDVDAMTKAGREVCDSAGVPVPPATGADITIPFPTAEVPSFPLPEVPSLTTPPFPELPSVTMPPLPELPSLTVPPFPEIPSVPPIPSIPNLPPNVEGEGTVISNTNSMSILPVESSGITYLDPILTPSAAASSGSAEPWPGAANSLSPMHNGAIYIGLLALVL